MKFVLLAFVVALANATIAQESAKPSADDWKIYVELKVFAGSAKKLNPLLAHLRDETKVNDVAAKLETMVESGDAEVVGTIASQTYHDHEITAFQGEQIRYPIEFESPSLIEGKASKPEPRPPGKGQDVSYPASTFETRNVGLSLELTAAVSDDGKRFIIDSKPVRTWFLKWDEFEAGRLANNDKILVKQPRFASAQSTSSFGMSSGERVLLGVHAVPGSPDQMEIMLLRVWSTPRKAR